MSGEILKTAANAVLPIVLLILLGYFLRCKGFLTEHFVALGNKLVFRICLPIMMFVNVYGIASLSEVRWDLCLYVVAAVTVLFALGWIMAQGATADRRRRGVLLQCSFRSNYAIIGLPLATTLGGEAAAAAAAVLSAIVVPLFNVLAVVSLSVFVQGEGKNTDVKKLLKNVAKNPLIGGVVAGLVALLLRWWQERQFGTVVFSLQRDLEPVYTALRNLKDITSPFALLMLGGQFRFSAVKELWKEVVSGTLFRTVVAPLIGVGAAVVLNAQGLLPCGTAEYPALIALFGSPVAVSSAIMAREMHNDEQLAAQLVVWTSVASIATIFLTVCLMMGMGILSI